MQILPDGRLASNARGVEPRQPPDTKHAYSGLREHEESEEVNEYTRKTESNGKNYEDRPKKISDIQSKKKIQTETRRGATLEKRKSETKKGQNRDGGER